VNIFLWR